jgi:CBS domain-containing protein
MHTRIEDVMYLRDIMSTNIEAARPGESLERAERRMRSRGIHHLVVISRGTVVGLICEATLQARLADGVATVGNAMHRHILTASPEMTVAQAARMMRGRAEGALPVFAGTRLVGIVTISDLLDVLGRRFASKARAPRAPAA